MPVLLSHLGGVLQTTIETFSSDVPVVGSNLPYIALVVKRTRRTVVVGYVDGYMKHPKRYFA